MSNPADARIQLHLLGAPEAFLDGSVIPFRSRKVLALLAYLAIEGGPHRREKLVELLWPDSAPGNGATTLRSTLSRLRNSLGPLSEALVTSGGSVTLIKGAGIAVDVAELDELRTSPMSVVERRLSALTRGPFMEGFNVSASAEYDEWVARWSSWTMSRSSELLERAARWYAEAGGRFAEAEAAIARWAAFASFDDAPVMLGMEISSRRGERSAALDAYAQHVDMLARELGSEPGFELAELAGRIRAGEVGYENPAAALTAQLEKGVSASTAPAVRVVYLDQALALLDTIDAARADELTAEVYRRRGRALEQAHRFDDARRNYEQLAERGRSPRNLSWQLIAAVGLARIHATPTGLIDPDTAARYASEALDLARLLGDRESEAEALWSRMLVAHYAMGDDAAASEYGAAALEIARSIPNSSTLPYILNDLHWVHASMGDLATATELLETALALWVERDDEAMLLDSLNGAGLLYTLVGRFSDAEESAERGIAVAVRMNNVWNQLSLRANLALALREQGRYDVAISALRAAIDVAASEMPVAAAYYEMTLATLLGDLGAAEEVEELCVNVDSIVGSLPPFWRAADTTAMLRIRSRVTARLHTAEDLDELAAYSAAHVGLAHVSILAPLVEAEGSLSLGEPERALRRIEELLAGLDASGAQLGRAEGLLLSGRALIDLGEHGLAADAFQRAEATARLLGCLRLAPVISMEAARLDEVLGKHEGARGHEASAREALSELRAGVPLGPYRDRFDAIASVAFGE